MRAASTTATALLVIDVQNGLSHPTFYGKSRSTPDCEDNIARLLGAARKYNENADDSGQHHSKVQIVHIQHHSTNPQSPLFPGNEVEVMVNGEMRKVPGVEPMECAKPAGHEEPVFVKSVNSAFIGTGLEGLLRARGIRQLLVCGLTTEHCVSTTVRMAGNLGVVDGRGKDERGTLVLVGDACAAHEKPGFSADVVHQVQLACLKGEFADVEWTGDVVKNVFGV